MGSKKFDFNAAVDEAGGAEAVWRLLDLAAEHMTDKEVNECAARLDQSTGSAAVEIRRLNALAILSKRKPHNAEEARL
jgi:hypothetical protein